MSKDSTINEFQQKVSDLLIRHRSVLDASSKFQETTSKVCRALTKAVTDCGCIEINGKKQDYKEEISQWKKELDTHLLGEMCESCLGVLKAEMGKHLFYMTAICNLLKIDLNQVVEEESKNLSTLGVFNLR